MFLGDDNIKIHAPYRINDQHIAKILLILHETTISQSINHLYDQVHVQVTFKQGLITLCCKLHNKTQLCLTLLCKFSVTSLVNLVDVTNIYMMPLVILCIHIYMFIYTSCITLDHVTLSVITCTTP